MESQLQLFTQSAAQAAWANHIGKERGIRSLIDGQWRIFPSWIQFCHPTNIQSTSSIHRCPIRLPTKTQPDSCTNELGKGIVLLMLSHSGHAYGAPPKSFWILFDVSALSAVSRRIHFCFLREIPPRLTIQNGVRTTSTKCVGSQKETVTPARVGLLHAQNQSFGVDLLSSWFE